MTDAHRFEDRVILITGGTSGIGLATARRLLDEGGQVIIGGRDAERGRRAIEQLGSPLASYEVLDVADRDSVDVVTATIDRNHGRLDALVNAAGAVLVRRMEKVSASQGSSTIDINLTGVFHCCQAALPLLRASAERDPGGHTSIVVVTSLDAVAGDPGMSAYNAAKAGALNLVRSLALELAPSIRVNSVAPGAIETPLSEATAGDPEIRALFENTIPLGRYGRPEEIAAAIAFLASAEAGFITGANLMIDGGMTTGTGHPDLLEAFGL